MLAGDVFTQAGVTMVKRQATCWYAFSQWSPQGMLDMTYRCDKIGHFFMTVMLDNTTVQGSPTELHVRSGTVNAANSHASGGVLDQANITARDNATFFVNVVDNTNNPIEGNDARVTVQENGVLVAGVKADYQGATVPGRYRVTLPLTKAGDNAITILVNDQPINAAVRHVMVLPTVADPKTTVATGDGFKGGDTDDMLTVTVQLRDRYSNDLHSPGAHNVTGNFRHATMAESGTVKVTDKADGTFLIEFTTSTSGKWFLDLKLDNVDISGSPFDVTIAYRMGALTLVGIAGGAVGLLLIIGAAFFFIRRRNRPKFTWERL